MPGEPSTRPSYARAASSRGKEDKNVVMASHGRAPWYGPDGKNVEAYVIGIAGGSASGKTSVARAILSALDFIPSVLILSQDAFYKKHSKEEVEAAFRNELDVDHPDSIDTPLFAECLADLKAGRATEIPVYSFVHHQRMPEKKYLYGASVIIVEGIMALQSPEMRDLYDLKVFVNCDSDLMLARRIKRDVKERGRDIDGILDQYLRFVKNAYDNFVEPSSKHADIIVPGSSNNIAIELLVTHIKRQLGARSLRFRNELGREAGATSGKAHLTNGGPTSAGEVILLRQTPQLLGIMTILRDQRTERGDFIFYADRLSTLIVEKALELIPYTRKDVVTPTGATYQGSTPGEDELVGVTILRSGGPFADGLRRVIRDVPLGAMLIQSDPRTGEPLLLSCDLPTSVKNRETSSHVRVLLLDSQMGTGAAALMAIRVLLDHGVPEQNITFLTFLVSARAPSTVHRAFPSVKIITAAIDPGLSEMHFPLTAPVMGEAAGNAEFATRLVSDQDDRSQGQVVDGDRRDEVKTEGDLRAEGGRDNFKLPTVNQGREELRFSRDRRRSGAVTEKRAWVVSPGMGHIGDRYYTE